jgi:predicted HTH transcriptional regulator
MDDALVQGKQRYLRSLVEYPEETASVEYKSAIKFDPKADFGVKMVKHILGHANAGGGFIIIGFNEDQSKKLQPDSNLDNTVAGSYETTRLCQSVDSFIAGGQRIELQVYKVEHEKRPYPVIQIQRFKVSPFFCGKDFTLKNGQTILREGAIYIRDQAAKTTVAATPAHWNQLLKTAVAQRQEEILNQFRALLESIGLGLPSGRSTPKGTLSAEVREWIEQEKAQVQRILRH